VKTAPALAAVPTLYVLMYSTEQDTNFQDLAMELDYIGPYILPKLVSTPVVLFVDIPAQFIIKLP